MIAAMMIALVVPQYPLPPQFPPLREMHEMTYKEASRKAIAESKPLVVFVGCPSRNIAGAVSVSVSSFENDKSPRIIVAVYERETLMRYTFDGTWHLPTSATDAEIMRRSMPRPRVQVSSPPPIMQPARAAVNC